MSTWLRDAKAEPEKDFIRQWNSQQEVQYQPWQILVDPLSEAFQDKDFNAAFTNNHTKIWPGEVGIVIICNSKLAVTGSKDEEFAKAVALWRKLSQIQASYKRPCFNQEFSICEIVCK